MEEQDYTTGYDVNLNEQPSKRPKGKGENHAEKVISILANVTLVIGCLVSVIYGGALMDNYFTHSQGIVVFIVGILSSVISWAFLMVIANISNNIRQIKHELMKMNSRGEYYPH